MKSSRKSVKTSLIVSSILMMLTLAWLTVSLPFVYSSQKMAQSTTSSACNHADCNDEDTDNPFSNTTEEKSSSTTSFSEEFLHDTHPSEHDVTVPSTEYKVEHASTYIAFHGELISPPPDFS
jgi:cytoskeletal protein RodZ